MIPLSDDNPTVRTPIITWLLLLLIGAAWAVLQGAGFSALQMVRSVCDLGLVPGEITGRARIGTGIQMDDGLACLVDADPINWLTPLTSMFLHGSWMHLLGNCLFFWVFGNNVEDSMGRLRFLVFYIVCGLAAAAAQVAMDPSSVIPMVGASGAISGVMGAYLVLHPRAKVNMLFLLFIFIRVIPLPAWGVLLWWFFLQIAGSLQGLENAGAGEGGGTAFAAHVGGFLAGLILIKLFENPELTHRQRAGAGRKRGFRVAR